MGEKEELERLRRLREQQISARDPLAKERAYSQRMAKRHKPNYLTDILKDPPYKVRWALWGVFIGLAVGVIAGIIVDVVFAVRWMGYVTCGVAVWGAMVGFVAGQSRDSGSENWR